MSQCDNSWSLPPFGSLKPNTNAAVVEGSQVIGISGVVRNHEEVVLLSFAKKFTGKVSVLAAELISAREIKFADMLGLDHGFKVAILEGDCLGAVHACNASKHSLAAEGVISSDVIKLCNQMGMSLASLFAALATKWPTPLLTLLSLA